MKLRLTLKSGKHREPREPRIKGLEFVALVGVVAVAVVVIVALLVAPPEVVIAVLTHLESLVRSVGA